MASVFEYFGIKKPLDFTPIPQFGVDGTIGVLQLKAKKYFTIEKEAQAADSNQLGVKIAIDFSLKNEEHLTLIRDSIALVKEKAAQLKTIDLKITSGVIVGVAASCLSFLPLMSVLSWIGWGAALYYMNQRSAAYAEYQESLTLLVATCNWGLGQDKKLVQDKKARKNEINGLVNHPDIRNMMATLYPVLSETQVRHLIADDIEEIFVGEFNEYEQRLEQGYNKNRLFNNDKDNIALSKRSAEFNRCMYGFNKGKVTDFLDALVSALPDLYRAAYHGFQQMKHWVQEKMTPAEDTQNELKVN